MAIINFSTLADGDKIKLGGDNLVFDGGISAVDVSIAVLRTGVQLSVAGKDVLLRKWELGNLNTDQVTFNNGSELLVGDRAFTTTDDNNANMIEPFFPGNNRRDQLRGMGGNDDLRGGEGDDLIFGQGGNDTLVGQGGADWLDGGKGGDIFQIAAAESPNGLGLFDKIAEFFSGSDKLDLDVEGEEDNYIEMKMKTDSYGAALNKATEILVANEGMKDYVFIAGGTKGWLFGEFTDDTTFDLAVGILNGDSLDKLDFTDII